MNQIPPLCHCDTSCILSQRTLCVSDGSSEKTTEQFYRCRVNKCAFKAVKQELRKTGAHQATHKVVRNMSTQTSCHDSRMISTQTGSSMADASRMTASYKPCPKLWTLLYLYKLVLLFHRRSRQATTSKQTQTRKDDPSGSHKPHSGINHQTARMIFVLWSVCKVLAVAIRKQKHESLSNRLQEMHILCDHLRKQAASLETTIQTLEQRLVETEQSSVPKERLESLQITHGGLQKKLQILEKQQTMSRDEDSFVWVLQEEMRVMKETYEELLRSKDNAHHQVINKLSLEADRLQAQLKCCAKLEYH